jgi:hypothetical protein
MSPSATPRPGSRRATRKPSPSAAGSSAESVCKSSAGKPEEAGKSGKGVGKRKNVPLKSESNGFRKIILAGLEVRAVRVSSGSPSAETGQSGAQR